MRPIEIVQQHADHLAAWLTFTGAIIVALIAAVTAQWRLRAQLRGESRRLDQQLASEEKRHRERVAFERGQIDRAEVRRLLDAVAEAASELLNAGAIAQVHASVVSRGWSDVSPDLTDKHRREFVEEYAALFAAKKPLESAVRHLRLRLEPADVQAVVDAARDMNAAAAQLWMELRGDLPIELGRIDRGWARSEELRAVENRLITAARGLTRANLD